MTWPRTLQHRSQGTRTGASLRRGHADPPHRPHSSSPPWRLSSVEALGIPHLPPADFTPDIATWLRTQTTQMPEIYRALPAIRIQLTAVDDSTWLLVARIGKMGLMRPLWKQNMGQAGCLATDWKSAECVLKNSRMCMCVYTCLCVVHVCVHMCVMCVYKPEDSPSVILRKVVHLLLQGLFCPGAH